MSVISKSVIENIATSIDSFISNIDKETKLATHPILLIGGIDVTVSLTVNYVTAKVGNIVVYKTKYTAGETINVSKENLLLDISERLFDNALIGSDWYKDLIAKLDKPTEETVKVELPAGYSVFINKDENSILQDGSRSVNYDPVYIKGFKLNDVVAIPKLIARDMVNNNFKPFSI